MSNGTPGEKTTRDAARFGMTNGGNGLQRAQMVMVQSRELTPLSKPLSESEISGSV